MSMPLDVTLLGAGTWNRAFLVRVHPTESSCTPPSNQLVMRLALPVLPGTKVLSEVATMRYVKDRTDIPVPRVYMYNASSNNQLGYEWILMEHMPGKPFEEVYSELEDDAKKLFARTMAEWMDSLSRLQFDAIGGLYMPHTGSDDCDTVVISETDCLPDPVIGQIASQYYACDWRPEYEFNRGPFGNIQDFLSSFAQAAYIEVHDPRQRAISELHYLRKYIKRYDFESDPSNERAEKRLREETSEERDDRQAQVAKNKARLEELLDEPFPMDQARDQTRGPQDDRTTTLRQYEASAASLVLPTKYGPRYGFHRLEKHQSTAKKLITFIESSTPSDALPAKSSVFHHWDVSGHNVLVDSTGRPTALLDWEQLHTVPLALALPYYPKAFGNPASISCKHCASEAGEMRESFDERLSELKSPYLAIKDVKGKLDERMETNPLARFIYAMVETAFIHPCMVDRLEAMLLKSRNEREELVIRSKE
ncbi:hypothetical protein GGR53DRAFT_526880 [Hypoxylon sp. FL1150]|nr:hypothetical protein GGR53DRAFT_526880 [Hypoxylon sp. FL1150]